MTTAEQKSITQLHSIIYEIRDYNNKFQSGLESQVKAISEKVEQKHIPYILEGEIVKAAQNAIAESITKALSGYNSPLEKYATNVVQKYQTSLESIFDNIVREGINSAEFKVRVREVLLNKIAKTVVSGIDGSIDKTINLMKQDAVFRSRLTLAVNNLVEEFLSKN